MKKLISAIIAVFIVVSLLTGTVFAAGSSFAPYKSYENNMFGEAVIAPVGYTVSKSITGAELGLDKELVNPYDITIAKIDGEDHIFILDSGNSRIIEINTDYELINAYENFSVSEEVKNKYNVLVTDQEKNSIAFNGATGFALDRNNNFVIADMASNRVLLIDRLTKMVTAVIERPDEALNDTGATFSPKKVTVDDKGRYYIASESIALGLMVFDENLEFIEFFGANEVLSTTQAIVKYIREMFYSVTQMEYQEQATPVIIRNMDFDKNVMTFWAKKSSSVIPK